MVGWGQDGVPLFDDWGNNPRTLEEMGGWDEMTELISANIKWDGCSNWSFPSTQSCMYHGCDKEDVVRIGAIMLVCWHIAEDNGMNRL